MNWTGRGWLALTLLVSCPLRAQSIDSLPAYHAEHQATGTIRIWGSAQMDTLVQNWQRGFSRFHPGVHFENHLYGAVSAIAGLYTGVADIVVNREIWPVESLAYEQVLGYRPTAFEVATGSFDVPTKSDSLEIFVHKDNPITGLTMSQLQSIFGPPGTNWGAFGLHGDWSAQPVNPYTFKLDNAGMLLFSELLMKPVAMWNSRTKAFENQILTDGSRIDAGALILEALSKDRFGIAISNLHYRRPDVKVVPIAVRAGADYVMPTKETVQNRAYPLSRSVYIILNRPPKHPIDPVTLEFLRYVLSRDGQQDVVAEGAYLPLPVSLAVNALIKLRSR
jgi:phosphate transport system substrate-binding protein